MSDTHGFGGGRSLTMRALSGAGKAFQAGGRPGSSRQVTHGFGFLFLGLVVLLISSGGGGLVWDYFSWPLIKASPGFLIIGLGLRAIKGPRMVGFDPQTGVPDQLPVGIINESGLGLVKTQQESVRLRASREDPETLTHKQIMERRQEPPPPPSQGGPFRVPTFAQVREAEPFKPGVFVPGVTSSGLVQLTLEKVGPGTVTGKQGTYKTALLVLAVAEAVDAGVRVIVSDPDAGHPQSLVNRLGPLADERILGYPMGTDEASCKRIMRMAYSELYEVIDKKLPTQPTLMVLDEANATATLGDKATREAFKELVKLMTWKARKQEWGLIITLQRPTEKDTGNDGLLQPFGWAMSGQVEQRVGNRALRVPMSAVPDDIGMLPLDGTFYLFDSSAGQIVKVYIPTVSYSDLAAIAEKRLNAEQVSGVQVLNGHTPAELEVTQPQQIVTTPPKMIVEDVDIEPGETPDEPLAKMRRLHMDEKMSNAEIMVECWGEKGKQWVSNPGRNYREAIRKIARASHGCTCGDPMHARYEQHLSEREKAEQEKERV